MDYVETFKSFEVSFNGVAFFLEFTKVLSN